MTLTHGRGLAAIEQSSIPPVRHAAHAAKPMHSSFATRTVRTVEDERSRSARGRPSGLVVYFADTITANVWEKQDGFFPIPTPWSNGSYVCYAAKSHESYADNAATHVSSGTALALRSTVVMSWVCNEADGQFSLLFGPQTFAPSTRAYWPELMRITLERTLY
jgi:hypothetical protein